MTDQLDRLKAALTDRYAIGEEIGSGGMATVFLAEDLKHHRNVAVKVLRPELAAVIGAERFLNEISVTAHLQHPHILPLFDSGIGIDRSGDQAVEFLYYVMPFVEGESLRHRLSREKQLPIDDAVRIALEVASALDYAHRHGVIHRDIKPGNILLHDGRALVADFGIALAVQAAGGNRITETGLSLGTPEYMSPEQATGDRELDARSDVYSLGAVLYEMLSGEPPHTGATVQAVIAKVVTDRPRAVRELRTTTPVHVEATLGKALAKLPADRCPSAAHFIELLERPELATDGIAASGAGRAASPSPTWLRWAVPVLLAWAGAASLLALWPADRTPSRALLSRWALEVPDSLWIGTTWGWWDHPIAISPDGTRIAFIARGAGEDRLFVRSIDEIGAVEITRSEGASSPFFSPDGQWVGFFAGGKLKKVSLPRGLPIEVTDVPGVSLGGSWGTNDTIVYAEGDRGLLRVSASGGRAEQILAFDPGNWVASPEVIRDGSAVLVTLRTERGPYVGVLRLPSGELTTLEELGTGAGARYASPGYILFAQAGVLRAVRFDETALQVRGPSVAVRDTVALSDGHPLYAVSDGGTLVYVPATEGDRRLLWVDRTGRSGVISERTAGYFRPRLSPDGKRVLVNITNESGGDLWLLDLERGSLEPLLPDAPSGIMSDAVWTPDGRRVTYYHFVRRGDSTMMGIVEVRADRIGGTDMLLPREDHYPHSWSPDGGVVAVYAINADPEFKRDILLLDRSGNLTTLFATRANERSPAFSPDGRWLAYVSDESGRDEVYVIAYPSLNGKTRISLEGGRVPQWRRDGGELFYRNGDRMMAVSVQLGNELRHGMPALLFEEDYWSEPILTGSHDYDVSLDGQRFLMISASQQHRLNVVLNWVQGLNEDADGPHD